MASQCSDSLFSEFSNILSKLYYIFSEPRLQYVHFFWFTNNPSSQIFLMCHCPISILVLVLNNLLVILAHYLLVFMRHFEGVHVFVISGMMLESVFSISICYQTDFANLFEGHIVKKVRDFAMYSERSGICISAWRCRREHVFVCWSFPLRLGLLYANTEVLHNRDFGWFEFLCVTLWYSKRSLSDNFTAFDSVISFSEFSHLIQFLCLIPANHLDESKNVVFAMICLQ